MTADLEVPAVQVPPLSVQVLAENAVKHGIPPKRDGRSVAISAAVVSGLLEISVVDDGVGNTSRS